MFEDDDEAWNLWHRHIGFPAERIVRMGRRDNFWGPVGETGVCGPSSEMHYDTGRPGAEGGPGADDGDRYIEYWNLVFPQFFYTEDGRYDPLPRPGIDTGMGLERIAFILQGARDNFHTDEFLPIRTAIESALPRDADRDAAARAVNAAADHVRALTFALAEGIAPSNEGRGYVLRRLLRRALTKMYPFGVREPFLARGVDAVVDTMKVRYPELESRRTPVREMVAAEEKRFLETLEQGMNRIEALLEDARRSKAKALRGEDVFQLYDTYGFPPELTAEIARDAGLDVDREGFEAAMERQRERARAASFHTAGDGGGPRAFHLFVEDAPPSEFVGYDALECDARALGVRPAPEARRRRLDLDEAVEVTTDRTVFYPEGGGQVGDAGRARFGTLEVDVVDTYRDGERIAHVVPWRAGDDPERAFADAGTGHLAVDAERRRATARHHTATHLLHAALRRVLGDHVAQAGSLVAPDRLRFDFHHFRAMTPEEIATVERLVNEAIMEDMDVSTRTMPYADAVALGAMALFGEKYGDVVRVVEIGEFSRELCGGTHTRHTGEIGPFFIRQESAVGSGTRRVEALTGRAALEHARAVVEQRSRLAELLRTTPDELEARVRQLMDEADALGRRLRAEQERLARERAADALADAETIGGLRLVAVTADADDVGALRRHADALRGRIDPGVALVCQDRPDRPVCLVVVSDGALQRGVSAREITRRIAERFGWRGGGRDHMTQMGVPSRDDLETLRAFVADVLREREDTDA